MILSLMLACKGGEDTAPPTECGRLEEFADAKDFNYIATAWPEGASLYEEGETPDQVHDSRSEWDTYLQVHGRADPVPELDLEGEDVLLWFDQYTACGEKEYTWLDAYARDGVRTVVGSATGDESCTNLEWLTAWLFIIDEVDGADDGNVCVEGA